MNAMLLQRQAMDKHGMVVTMDVKGKFLALMKSVANFQGLQNMKLLVNTLQPSLLLTFQIQI